MRFLYLVEEQHAVGRLPDGVGQQTSVLVAHISRRRTDKLRHGMLLCVLTHVEAHKAHAELVGENPCHLRLSHTRRSDEEKACHGLLILGETCLCHLHRLHHLVHGGVLTVYLTLHVVGERHESVVSTLLQHVRVNLAKLRQHFAQQSSVNALSFLRGKRMSLAVSSSLVQQVHRLVRQEAVLHIARRIAHGILRRTLGILHAMEFLISRQQSAYDAYGVVNGRLRDVNLLKTAHQRFLSGYVTVKLVVRRRSDKPYHAVLQVRLEDVGTVQ